MRHLLRQLFCFGFGAGRPMPPLSDRKEARGASDLAGLSREITTDEGVEAESPIVELPKLDEQVDKLKNGTLQERTTAASLIVDAIERFPVKAVGQVGQVVQVLEAGRDLVEKTKPAATRIVGWTLFARCSRKAATEVERRACFHVLVQRAHAADVHLQLDAVSELTKNGRDVSGFEYELFPLLTKWLGSAFDAVKARRSATRGMLPASSTRLSLVGDQTFWRLFALLAGLIKCKLRYTTEPEVGHLMDILFRICIGTCVQEDLVACIDVINALVTYASIPKDKLRACSHVLASIHCMVQSLQKKAWKSLANMLRSHHGQSMVWYLLESLRDYRPRVGPSSDEKVKLSISQAREVRGALSVLNKLVGKSAHKGYPPVPLVQLIDGLENLSRSGSSKIVVGTIKMVNTLFHGSDGEVLPLLAGERWSNILTVALQCTEKCLKVEEALPLPGSDELSGETVHAHVQNLIRCLENKLVWDRIDPIQRRDCVAFLAKTHPFLADSGASIVLHYYRKQKSCVPPEAEWQKNLHLLFDHFFLNRRRSSDVRLEALTVVTEACSLLDVAEDGEFEQVMDDLLRRLLACVREESDGKLFQAVATFMVPMMEKASPDMFHYMVDVLQDVATSKRVMSSATTSPTIRHSFTPPPDDRQESSRSMADMVTRTLVHVFVRVVDTDASKAKIVFDRLLNVATSNCCEMDARLTALNALFLLGAESEDGILVSTREESSALALGFYRTRTRPDPNRITDGRAQGERRTESRAEQGAVGRAVAFDRQQMSSATDPDAFPDRPKATGSEILLTAPSGHAGQPREGLDMGSFLDAVMDLLNPGCDWEVYSFVIIHLPASLQSQSLYRAFIPQINQLRRVICDKLRLGAYAEPPPSSGLRRVHVANCLYQCLMAIMTYHQHFRKAEHDEVVQILADGIMDKTARTCIHALSVCGHEVPMSVSRALPLILENMARVITQASVAIDILEFLAGVSRQRALYANFTDADYRTVFAICFRYIQTVRDLARADGQPSALAGPAERQARQSELETVHEYVYALAYHVITFWFLALRLYDRPTHISWIAKNLFTNSDGTASSEEQAQTTMDFLQRVTYSNVADSAEDELFREDSYGEIVRKSWIIGNGLVSIKQAKESGWAEITRRHPSGTSSFSVRPNVVPPAEHVGSDGLDGMRATDGASGDGRFLTGSSAMPSHLLLQLLAPIPLRYEPDRPIPLPEDDFVKTAMHILDVSSTVDGHKIGVIYLAEGQTNEAEILANTSGGPDYDHFLSRLGTLTRLKGATFNTQGLDRRNDMDGQHAYCWRDRVTEIVFHVTTLMPTNLERDRCCVGKKRHIGNDFVNIIWNRSKLPFDFDTFPSQFNYCNIVITPTAYPEETASRKAAEKGDAGDAGDAGRDGLGTCPPDMPFFTVQLLTKRGMPEISPASEIKMVSLRSLPAFVRLLALNASVFSQLWADRDGLEHVSSWCRRLREIRRLRERYGGASGEAQAQAHAGPASRTPAGDSSTTTPTATAQAGHVLKSLNRFRRQSAATVFTGSGRAEAASALHRPSNLPKSRTEHGQATDDRHETGAATALVSSMDFSKWTG